MRAVVQAAMLLVCIASTAQAQRQCRKGIPCGGSCISASKTCHVGTSPEQALRATSPDSVRAPVRRLRAPSATGLYAIRRERDSLIVLVDSLRRAKHCP